MKAPWLKPRDVDDGRRHLSAGFSEYRLARSHRSLPFLSTGDDVEPFVDSIVGYQFMRGSGGRIAILYETPSIELQLEHEVDSGRSRRAISKPDGAMKSLRHFADQEYTKPHVLHPTSNLCYRTKSMIHYRRHKRGCELQNRGMRKIARWLMSTSHMTREESLPLIFTITCHSGYRNKT